MRVNAVLLGSLLIVAFAACSAQTEPPTSVTSNSATLHATVSWDASDGPGELWYEYRPVGGGSFQEVPGSRADWPDMGGSGGPADVPYNWTGISPGEYEYRFCGYGDKDSPSTVVCFDSDGVAGQSGAGYDRFVTNPVCDDTQGAAESLSSFISSNPAGTLGDPVVLCLRSGSQDESGYVSPKAHQTLTAKGESNGTKESVTVRTDFHLTGQGSRLEDFRVVGCHYDTYDPDPPGLPNVTFGPCTFGGGIDKVIRMSAPGVVLDHMDVTQRNGRNGDAINCIIVGPEATGSTVQYSRSHGCGHEYSSNHDHGIYCQADDFTSRGNWLYDNEGFGIQLYPDCDNALVVGTVAAENGAGCNISGDGSPASDDATYRNGFCGFTREDTGYEDGQDGAWFAPIHCGGGGNGDAIDMVLYDPSEYPTETDCGASLTQTGTLESDPVFQDRTGYDFRVTASAARAKFGTYADNLPGPRD